MPRLRVPKFSRLAAPLLGAMVGGLIAVLRRAGPERAADSCAWLARKIGPRLREQRIGRAQLRAAFPERDDTWIEATLLAAWDNLGRVVGEYVHLDRIWDYDITRPGEGRIETDAGPVLLELRDDGKPALLFAAHLANWELPALAASAHGLPAEVVYRMPNNRWVAASIEAISQAAPAASHHQCRATRAFQVARRTGRSARRTVAIPASTAAAAHQTPLGRRSGRSRPSLTRRRIREGAAPGFGVRGKTGVNGRAGKPPCRLGPHRHPERGKRLNSNRAGPGVGPARLSACSLLYWCRYSPRWRKRVTRWRRTARLRFEESASASAPNR